MDIADIVVGMLERADTDAKHLNRLVGDVVLKLSRDIEDLGLDAQVRFLLSQGITPDDIVNYEG